MDNSTSNIYQSSAPSESPKEWAKQFSKEHKASMDYLLKFGSNFDKKLVGLVHELAEGDS